jgi:hypothetical protein
VLALGHVAPCDLVKGACALSWGILCIFGFKVVFKHYRGDFCLILCPKNGFFEDFRPFEGGFDPRKRPDLEGSWDSSSEP